MPLTIHHAHAWDVTPEEAVALQRQLAPLVLEEPLLYVSVGHRVTLAEAIDITLACTTRYRLPEPTRQAHLVSNQK